ncbi:DUF305 domain-containing protein [Streptomyces sp. NPDC051840]|uniref:DUF305 domain-containing protein n=1 Tax=unclassified Streptomyces TaxID=2593676 RepID=UPI00343F9746
MTVRRLAPLLLLLALLSSCAGEGGTGTVPLSGPASGSSAPAPSAGPTDSAWVQLMIPMDDSAVALLDLAAERATRTGLRSWASRLREDLATELAGLRALRDGMRLPDTDVHEGHDMPGMVTATDLEAAGSTRGEAFDRLLVARIRDHLRQSERVSRSETSEGEAPEARALARTLVADRGEQLADLAGL